MKLPWILAIAAIGCSKKDPAPDQAKPAEPPKVIEAAKPPEPFKGTLTVAIVMGSKGTVKSLEPWDQGFAKLQGKLGAPTKVDGKKYLWAVLEGDDCAYTYVTKEDGAKFNVAGDIVSTVSDPGKYGKADAIGNRNECLAILGKDGPAEDPNAAAPPADGKVTVGMLVDNASKGRSKWDGHDVTVSGVLARLQTMTTNGKSTTDLYIQDAKDKTKEIRCSLSEGSFKMKNGGKLSAKAKIEIHKAMNGTGETVYDVELAGCTVTK